jgi:hypothetical protein
VTADEIIDRLNALDGQMADARVAIAGALLAIGATVGLIVGYLIWGGA